MNEIPADLFEKFSAPRKREVGLEDVRLRAENDPRWFIENYLYIATKARHDSLLKFNHSQEKVWQFIEDRLAKSLPIRLNILKSRQVGISTQLAGYAFARWWSEKNLNALVIAHLKQVTSNLFKKQKKFYANLRPELQLSLERSNKQELIQDMRHGGSQLFLSTAGSPHEARSQTIHFVHGSEAAFYPDLVELKTALEASVPDEAGTAIFWESTAFGAGTDFHEQWKAGMPWKPGQEDDEHFEGYYNLFLKWFEDPLCSLDPFDSDLVKDRYLERVFAKVPDLKDRQEHYGLTAEQICWYFHIGVSKYNSNWLKMQQEFPCDADEAFLSTGATVIPAHVIQQYKNFARAGQLFDPTDMTKDPATWRRDESLELDKHTYLEVHSMPKQGRHYLVVIDTASGHAEDYSCSMVFDIATQNLCAELHGKIEPKRLAHLSIKLAEAYNYAVIVPETNGLGVATLSHIEDKYFHVYRRRTRGSVEGVQLTNKLGWDTNPEMRWVILSTMRRIMMDRLADNDHPEEFLPSRGLCAELATFIQPPTADQKPQAVRGCHDDRVMCAAIGIYCCLEELQFRPDIAPTIQKRTSGDNKRDDSFDIDRMKEMVEDKNWTGLEKEWQPNSGKVAGPFVPDVEIGEDDDWE